MTNGINLLGGHYLFMRFMKLPLLEDFPESFLVVFKVHLNFQHTENVCLECQYYGKIYF